MSPHCKLFAFLFICLVQPAAQTLEWRNGIAKVTTKFTERAPGTAFVVALRNGAAFLVTGSHVVAGDGQPRIDFLAAPDKSYRAETLVSDYDNPTRGLAILKVENAPEELRILPPGDPVQGAKVIVAGFPSPQGRFSLLDPIISRIDGLDVVLSQSTPEGYSGGPVMQDGKVAGLVFGRQGVGLALHPEQISLYLRRNDVHWRAANVEETAARAKPQPARAGETRVNPIDQQTYVYIPPGKFTMGCSKGDSECDKNESPPREVEITRGFWMGRTETTQEAWSRVIKANPGKFQGGTRPVENVNWNEAKGFCELVKMRLPTEAEWEYAARAGDENARYGTLENVAWYGGNSGSESHPVSQKTANGWGLHDTLGNVWEWVNDWYGPYGTGRATDPRGPSSGQFRVVRGGSWYYDPQLVRVSLRSWNRPAFRNFNIGFRCAGELP